MKQYEEQLSPEALLLDEYLSRYKRCIRRKHTLEHRKNDIIREFNHPLKSVSYDGMPRGNGGSLGCASLSFRLDEIETRINEQIEKSVKVLTEIMNIIEFLPSDSMERAIIEHRYIDCMKWWQICKEENLSRTPANNYWKKGLYKLLEYKKVQMIVKEYEENAE